MRCRPCAFGRIALYVLFTLLLMPVQWAAVKLGARLAARLPVFYHRICLRLIGLKVIVRGEIAPRRPILFVGNHSSYLDIIVLSSVLPVSFVAKHEIAGWPFFGMLAQLQRTVFIDRKRRGRVRVQRDEMASRLAAGDNLVLFPEGTSDDGSRVLPFKSALFGAAETALDGHAVTVQPVSIAYTRLDGIPLGRALRPFLAWYGDMDLLPHIVDVFALGKVDVEVTFLSWTTHRDRPSRRELSDYCHRAVEDGLIASLTGREAESEMAAPQGPLPAAAAEAQPDSLTEAPQP